MTRWTNASESAKEAARVRNRRWRANHRDELLEKARAKRAENPEYHKTKSREWHAAHRDEANARVRERVQAIGWRTYVHGVSAAEHDALYRAQGGRCAVCDEPRPKTGANCLVIDHDHGTGERRGLLCIACNSAIQTIDRLGATWALRALAYLGDPPLRRIRKASAS